MLNLFLSSILLPLFGVILLWRRARVPFVGWFSSFWFALGLTAFSFLAAPWGWFGIAVRHGLLLLFVAATVVSLRRPIPEELVPEGALRLAAKFLIGLFFGMVGMQALQARAVPRNAAVDLKFPLRNGTYLVAHGGSSLAANFHYAHPRQKYALDLVKLKGGGMRAGGFMPRDVTKYAIWNEPVYSPCSGTVAVAVDGLPDNAPPGRDEKNLAGNHVIVRCGDVNVLLAHLRKGSVAVKAGATVTGESILGNVGNSGDTTEPHLHIHAQRGAGPVGMTFDGRWLVRNSIVRP